ncbi:MAG: hypothetical protein JSW11_11450 [Candidatus Heimdallarchaeota archaeon]|nr:MAG: hypothetical protein JSW11_11450 [Candidatus Heimdallarchaeota archaeon]
MITVTKEQRLENYPIKIVCSSVTLTVISYLLGTLVLYVLHPFLGILYLLLAVSTIIVSMKLRCSYCYYLGKYCNFGLGKLAALFFKKGISREFQNPKKVISTAILSFGTMLLPVITGFGLILFSFSLINFSLLLVYILFGILPGFLVRGNFCDKCIQGQLGCPAYQQMIKGREK